MSGRGEGNSSGPGTVGCRDEEELCGARAQYLARNTNIKFGLMCVDYPAVRLRAGRGPGALALRLGPWSGVGWLSLGVESCGLRRLLSPKPRSAGSRARPGSPG